MKIYKSAPSPANIIQELYLKPSGLTPNEAANLCTIEEEIFEGILNHKVEIGYELALKLSKGFGTSYHFWLNLQREYLAQSHPHK